MLRNSFIEHYKPKSTKTKFFEKEIALFRTDIGVINSQRPMSTRAIKKLPKAIFPEFIDDIMCNNVPNTLLYSSNARKERYFYIKQKNYILNSNYVTRKSSQKKELSKLGALMLNRTNIQKMESLNDRIKKFLINRDKKIKEYKIKQENFYKINPSIDSKNKKLFYKPMNEIRLEGYKRALNNCLIKSKSDKYFEMPNIQFNMEDVFSRLSKNIILNQKTLKKIIQKEKEIKEKQKNDSYNLIRKNQIKNLKNIPNKKLQTIISNSNRNNQRFTKNLIIKNKNKTRHKTDTIDDDNKYNDQSVDNNKNFDYYNYNIRNMPTLNISKILNFSSGKEFIIKITPKIKKRCLSVLSCGPKPKPIKRNLSSEKKDTEEEKIDYEEIKNRSIYNINNSRSKKNINNIILYNTLKVEKNFPKNNVVRLMNYRDENFNSNLHIAVINDSIKLIKYFLDKKLSPNELNDEGKTPLHLAMKKGNIKIIELLIQNGASTQIKDKKGKKPFDYASRQTKHYFNYENPK